MKGIEIKGVMKVSLIDYPGKIASTIFLNKCNFRCPFCHNPELVLNNSGKPDIPPKEILEYLESRKKWLDGVCITGGEPTLHPGLKEFIKAVKEKGFLVKLDTNGYAPGVLEELIKEKLVDFIAMDIKASEKKYSQAAGIKVDLKKIKESVKLIRESGIDYEFRATVLPEFFSKNNAIELGKWLNGSKKFVLQQFQHGVATVDPDFVNRKHYTPGQLQELCEILKPYFKSCEVRGI